MYQKAQSRVGKESRQRLIDARIRMIITFEAQIQSIKVFVERIPEAALLCNDFNGRVELETKMGKLESNKVGRHVTGHVFPCIISDLLVV